MINLTALSLPFLLSRLSHRTLIVVGGVVAGAAMMGVAFSTSLVSIFVCTAIAFAACAMVYTPGMVASLTWFFFLLVFSNGQFLLDYSFFQLFCDSVYFDNFV